MAATPNAIAVGIQMGAKTHHHDHEMTPASFNPMNRIASMPIKPMPPRLAVFVPPLIYFSFCHLEHAGSGARHARQRVRVGRGLLERELRRRTERRGRVAKRGLQPARVARRFLARRPREPALRVPRQALHREPALLPRVPCGPDAHTLNLYILTSSGGSKGGERPPWTRQRDGG